MAAGRNRSARRSDGNIRAAADDGVYKSSAHVTVVVTE